MPQPPPSPTLLIRALLDKCTFPAEGPFYCAVSGGADSLALLILAASTGHRVVAVHVDHGLRPTSADDASVVAEAARRFGADFVTHKVKVDSGPNLEARARTARYGVLPEGVLTGHTADDQAETVLLNLMRGAGLAGLAAMTPSTRPMLSLRRAETHSLCADVGVVPIYDESNDSSQFRRNRVRHELLPLLDDIAERDVAAVIARQTQYLHDDDALLDALAADLDAADALLIAGAPKALASRAIRQWLRTEMDDELHPPSSAAVERVLAVARGEAQGCEVGSGLSVRRSHQRLFLHPHPAEPA